MALQSSNGLGMDEDSVNLFQTYGISMHEFAMILQSSNGLGMKKVFIKSKKMASALDFHYAPWFSWTADEESVD